MIIKEIDGSGSKGKEKKDSERRVAREKTWKTPWADIVAFVGVGHMRPSPEKSI